MANKHYTQLVLNDVNQWELNTTLPHMENPTCTRCLKPIGDSVYYWCKDLKSPFCTTCQKSKHFYVLCGARERNPRETHIHECIVITRWDKVTANNEKGGQTA